MTHKEFQEYHKTLCDQAREITVAKNHDYSGPPSPDPMSMFSNFMRCEQFNICSTEAGFLTRLTDKFARLCNLTRPGVRPKVVDESIEDTVKDIINYLVLLLAFLRTRSGRVNLVEKTK